MRALPSLRQLHYLVVLSEYLHFTRAAEACFVTQSTLSAGIKELENVLDTQLVERDRQTVMLTPLGKAVAARARELLAAAEDLVELAQEVTDPMSGQMRLGVIPTIAPFVLPDLLAWLRQRHPGLRPVLREDLTANLLERVGRGDLDFALIALPYDTGGMLERSLYDDEMWLVSPASEPAPDPVRVSPDMLDRLLLLEEGHCLREHALSACGAHVTPNKGGLEATSLLTLVHMANAGLGLALMPEMAVRSGLLNHTGLVARPLSAPAPKRTVALVARRTTARRDAFEQLADAVMTVERERRRGSGTSRGRLGAGSGGEALLGAD